MSLQPMIEVATVEPIPWTAMAATPRLPPLRCSTGGHRGRARIGALAGARARAVVVAAPDLREPSSADHLAG
jgi:hypothetical protein